MDRVKPFLLLIPIVIVLFNSVNAGSILISFQILNHSLNENQMLYYEINSSLLTKVPYIITLRGPEHVLIKGFMPVNSSSLYLFNISDLEYGSYTALLNASGILFSIFGGTFYVNPNPAIELIGCGSYFLYKNSTKVSIKITNVGNTPLSVYSAITNYSEETLNINSSLLITLEVQKSENISVFYSFGNKTYTKYCYINLIKPTYSIKVEKIVYITNSSGNYYFILLSYNGTIPLGIHVLGSIDKGALIFNKTYLINSSVNNLQIHLANSLAFDSLNISYVNSTGALNTYSQEFPVVSPLYMSGEEFYAILLAIGIALIIIIHKFL
jgi:hypothetical protein